MKNARGQEVPVYTAQCAYHVYSCLGDHEEDYPPKVAIPNADGLCMECFYHKHKHAPPKITLDTAPNVYDPKKKIPTNILENNDKKSESQSQIGSTTNATEKALLDDKNLIQESQLNADSICCWVPSVEESFGEMRGYICKNKVFYNPETRQYLPTCAMHIKTCIKSHIDSPDTPIEIPNLYGLCNIHHVATYGSIPVKIPFPYPGVEKKLKSKGWLIKPGHWSAPTWPPLKPVISTKKYRPLRKPETYLEKMQELARVLRYLKRKKEFGKLAATAIQAIYRGYRIRYIHKQLKLKKNIPIRAEKVLIIQCQIRRFLSTKYVQARRLLYNTSATNIQKVYHGYLVRKWVKRDRAARVLQRASRMWRDRHFFNTVMMMVQLRKLFQRRIDAAIEIQRIIRGYLSRLNFSRYRKLILLKFHTAARIIQILFAKHKKYLEEKRRLARLNDRTKMMRKLAQLIEELYFQRQDRIRLWQALQNAAPVMQSLVRGFLGRTKAVRMKFLRKALRTWCEPHFATEFMREILERKIAASIYVSDQLFQLKTLANVRSKRKDDVKFIDFLPEIVINKTSIDKRIFLFTLSKYYEHLKKPLLISELQSIYKRFRDPIDGKIPINEVNRYISVHKHPCHKHGRTICGTCIYHRECFLSGCFCRCFERDEITGKVCKECHHSITVHKIFPLDQKPSRKKANKELLKILSFVSDPDLSLPTSVKGLELTDIGKQYYIEKQKRIKLKKETLRLENEQQLKNQIIEIDTKKQLFQSLSTLQIPGDEISTSKEYWEEKSPTLPLNTLDNRISITVSTFEPNTSLTSSEFWSNATSNPNKTVRDYHEKFQHNMPMPIVTNDEIVYTLEGSRVYVEILKKLIILYENDHKNGIHSDNGDFLKLIMNHIQLFERHWRKIVIDIRTGQLNKHAKVPKYARDLYLSTAIPRPSMALKLDTAFRELGFHMKVLGKDIKIQQYAEKKIPKDDIKRKPSFPLNSYGSSGFLPPSINTLNNNNSIEFSNSNESFEHFKSISQSQSQLLSSPSLSSSLGKLSPLRPIIKHTITSPISLSKSQTLSSPLGSPSKLSSSLEKSVKFDTFNSTTTLSPSFERLRSSQTSPLRNTTRESKQLLLLSSSSPSREKLSKSEALVLASTAGKLAVKELTQRENEKLSRGATANRNNLVRRGSDTDIVRPITNEEVHRISHDVQTEARTKYYHLISVGGRFICPFPACGASFTSREPAFMHLKTHEQKRKLQVPTPLADSHLNYYWPEDNNWKDSKEYKKRTLPPGSILCTVSGCKEVFSSYHRLEYHLKRIHKIESKFQLLHSFYKFIGRHSCVTPPYPPPEYSPAEFCPKHLNLLESCSKCVKILDSENLPKQPLYFYDRIKVSFNKRDGKGSEILFDRLHTTHGVIYTDENGFSHRGRVKGIVKDKNEDGWFGCEKLFSIEEAQEIHQPVEFDSDHRHELVIASKDTNIPSMIGEPESIQWVRLLDVVTVFPLLEVSKDEFMTRLRNQEFNEHTYFIRPTIDNNSNHNNNNHNNNSSHSRSKVK